MSVAVDRNRVQRGSSAVRWRVPGGRETAANIAGEVHEALQHLGVDRHVLMGHSISGFYALE